MSVTVNDDALRLGRYRSELPLVLEEVAYDDCMTFYRNHGYAQQ